MKIAIISDTHDNSAAVVWIIEYLNQHGIKTALHAGDIISPGICGMFAEHFAGHLHFVFGNNDGETGKLSVLAAQSENITCHQQEMRLEIYGKTIFMNHYSTISETVAKSGDFAICIGGHDHLYRVIQHGIALFINPGHTFTRNKWFNNPEDMAQSFVVLDLATMEHEQVLLPDTY